MALAERQTAYHRMIIGVVYRIMGQLAASPPASSAEIHELRQELQQALPWWRGLLRVHEPADGNRCRSCRTWYGGSRAWPCPIWRDAIQTLDSLNNMYRFLSAGHDPASHGSADHDLADHDNVQHHPPPPVAGAGQTPAPIPRQPTPRTSQGSPASAARELIRRKL